MNHHGCFFSFLHQSAFVKFLSLAIIFFMTVWSVEPAMASFYEENIPYNLQERLQQIRAEVDWEYEAMGFEQGILQNILPRIPGQNSSQEQSPSSNHSLSNLQKLLPRRSNSALNQAFPFIPKPTPSTLSGKAKANVLINPDPVGQLPSYVRETLPDDVTLPTRSSQADVRTPKESAEQEEEPSSAEAESTPSEVPDTPASESQSVSDEPQEREFESEETLPISEGLSSKALHQTYERLVAQKDDAAPQNTYPLLAQAGIADSEYMLLAQAGCYDQYPVGHGSSRQALFIDAYNRNGGGGTQHLGCTINAAHWWGGTVVQDFRGSVTVGDTIIIHDEPRDNPALSVPAYVVVGGVWRRYRTLGGPGSWLGVPTSDAFFTTTYTHQYSQQNFEHGYITYDMGISPVSNRPKEYAWPAKDPNQWWAEYHNGFNLNGAPTRLQNEPTIDHNWGTNPPGGACYQGHPCWGVWKDNFSVRWTKRQYFKAGRYTFTAGADDGVIMWVDGQVILNEWRDQGYTEFNKTITLTEGNHDLKVEYYEKSSDARIKITWKEAKEYELTVARAGSGMGGVIAQGITCGQDCSEIYEEGTQVALAAIPDIGSTFVGWEGGCSGPGDCRVTMDSAKNVIAHFARNGMALHYKFDGNTLDASGSNFHGTLTGTLTYPDGKLAQAALFNGSTTYVTAENAAKWLSFGGKAPFSIEAWVNPRSGGQGGTIVGKFNGSVKGEYYLSILPDGKINFHREVSPYNLASTQTIPFDQFSYVVVTYDGTDMKIYINGVLSATQASGAQAVDMATPVLVGAQLANNNPAKLFDGSLDNVKIYNRALTAEEIEYFSDPDISGLIAHWPLDVNADDLSANRLNGKINGTVDYVEGAIEKAASFNGTNSYIELGNAPYTDFRGDEAFTVSMWVKGGSRGMALDRLRYYFRFMDSEIQFVFKQSVEDQDPYVLAIPYPANWKADGWNCVTFVYGGEGARRKIFVNNVLAGSQDHLPFQSFFPLSTLKIGKSDYEGGMYFSGQLDDVKMYSYALTPDKCNCSLTGRPYPLSQEERERLSKLGIQECMPGSGDPVNSATGQLFRQDKDLVVPGLGNLDFALIRTYNSHDNRQGLFGFGWSSFLDMSLRIANDDSIDVRHPDGKGTYFVKTGDAYLPGQGGTLDTLTQTASGFTLTRPDQMVYLFDPDGNLTHIRNRYAHEITFERDAAGKLTHITDTAGRVFQVTQQGGQITAITDPAGRTVRYAYDASGDLTQATDANGGVWQYQYRDHKISAITDPAGTVFLRNTYDSEGRVIAQQNATGNTSTWDYSVSNQTLFTDNLKHTTRYVYDNQSRVSEIDDALGLKQTYVYNANNLLTKYTDKRGNTWTYTYDQHGNLLSETDPLGATTRYAYNATNDLISMTTALGDTMSYVWNAGKLMQIVQPDGSKLQFTYTSTGQLKSVTDANGRTTAYVYNAQGLLTTITNPLGGTTKYGYDAVGRQISMTDPNGNTSFFAYDGNDNVTRITYPNGKSVAVVYNGNNLISKQTDRLGGSVTYQYDANLKLIAETDPAGNITRYEYDAMYRRVKKVDPRGNITLYRYNADDRLVEIEDALGGIIRFEHDANGNVAKMTGPLGHQALFVYDSLNRLTKQVDPMGGATSFTYNLAGQLTKLTQPSGASTQYTYNRQGRPVEIRDALGQTMKMGYDAAGQLTQITDPAGRITTLEYDAGGNIRKRVSPTGATMLFAYDGVGNRIAVTDALGRISRQTYDLNDNLIALTDPSGSAIKMAYDANDRLIALTNANGNTSAFEYNALGLPVKETDFAGRTTQYEYDAASNLVKEIKPNGAAWTNAYDKLNRRVSATDPLGNVVKFAYNSMNQMVSMTDPLGNITRYEYDGLDRMLKETDPLGNVWQFAYDIGGRLITQTSPRGAMLRYTYNLNDQLVAVRDALGGEQKLEYDAIGNLTRVTDAKGRVTTMQYDAESRLIEELDALGQKTKYAYDAVGNLLTRTDALGRVTTHQYDNNDRLTAIMTPLGSKTTFEYDKTGNLLALTDANNHATRFTYDPNGLLTAETLPGGQTTRYEYDTMQNLRKYVNAKGSAWSFEYDALDQMTRATDPLGKATSYKYDKMGRLAEITDALGSTTRHAYDALSCLTQTTDPLGGVWKFACDAAGNITSQTNPRGAVTSFTYDLMDQLVGIQDALGGKQSISYDAIGNVTGSTDANGHAVTFAYNEIDRLTEQRDAEGNTTKFAYDSAGNLTALTDALGRVTRYAYNANDALIEMTDALGGKTRMAYDAVGNVNTITNANGHTTRFAYDVNDLLIAETMPGGQTTRYEYDAAQNLIKRINGMGNAWSYSYDALNRLIKEADPLGNATAFEYDALGNLAKWGDANGRITQYEYDALARLTAVRQPLNAVTKYAYDSVGNLTGMTNANGETTQFGYDLLDRLISEVNPLGKRWEFEYDAVGNLIKRNANGAMTQFAYNGNNRVTQIAHQDGSNVSFAYDAVSNQIEMTDRLGKTQNQYDALNRLTATTNGAGYQVGYAYDATGNLTRLTYPDKRTVNYEYDVNELVSNISDPELNVFTVTRDAALNVTGVATPNGPRAEYEWDAAERLIGVRNLHGSELISAFQYTLDPVGNRVKAEEEYSWRTPRTLTQTYTYDALNRLTRSDDSEGNFTEYTFDAVGNRLSQTTNIAANPAERLKTEYQYGAENRLVGVKNFTANQNGGWALRDETAITYDGLDRAARRIHTQNGTQTQIDYVYDGLDPMAEYLTTPSGTQHFNYYRGVEQLLSMTAVNRQGEVQAYNFHSDGLNSVSAITDPQGRLAHGYRYQNYGGLLNQQDLPAGMADVAAPRSGASYTGQEWDQPNGLYHFFSRDYDPEVGVWLQQDAFRGDWMRPETLHRYAYVAGNPISAIDKYGFFGWNDVKKAANKAKNYVKDKASDAYNYTKEKVTQAYHYVEQKVTQAYNYVKEQVSNAYNYVKDKVVQGYNYVKGKVTQVYNYAKDKWNQAKDWVQEKAQELRRKTEAFVQSEIKKLPQSFQDALKTGKQIITGDAMKMVTSSIVNVWKDPIGSVMSAAQKADKFVNWVEDKSKFIAENGIKRCQLFVDDAINLGKTGLQKVGEFFEEHPRLAGALQFVGGVGEAALGLGFALVTAETGVGIVAGLAVFAHGLDQAQAGLRTTISGKPTDTLTSTGLQKLGVPQPYANLIDGVISIVGTAGIGLATSTSSNVGKAGILGRLGKTGASSSDDASKVIIGNASKTKPKIDVKHLFHGEINKNGNAVGFHHRGSIGYEGKARVTRITNPKNSQGVYKGTVDILDSSTGTWIQKGPKSSFFPDEWSRGKVLSEVRGAYNSSSSVAGKSSNYWQGVSPSGVRIGGYLDSSGDIKTAFPIY